MNTKELLGLRKAIKAKKPDFIREDSHKRKRVASPWRKPKGLHSKMRHRFAGHRSLLEPGFKSPKAAKGLDKSGLIPVLVASISDIEKMNKEKQGAILSSKVGTRNKIALIRKAAEKGIKLLNLKDPAKFLKEVEDDLKKRKESKLAVSKEKEEKAKAAIKKSEEKKPEKEQDAEKAKQEEKKELDKFLTKKEA